MSYLTKLPILCPVCVGANGKLPCVFGSDRHPDRGKGMKKDALLMNKIAAAGISAALFGMITAELAGALYSVDDGTMPIEQQAFVIAEPADVSTQVAAAPAAPKVAADILPMLASADIAAGADVAKKCVSCHSFDEGGANKTGPALYGVLNRDVAALDFKYSDSLVAYDGVWDYQALNNFLWRPKDYIPGNKMNFRGVRKDQERADLIAYLRSLSANPAPLP